VSGRRSTALYLMAGTAASGACLLVGPHAATPTIAALWGAVIGTASYVVATWVEGR
jgi:hypothetical protein